LLNETRSITPDAKPIDIDTTRSLTLPSTRTQVENRPLSDWTKQSYKVVLKKFYKWLRHGETAYEIEKRVSANPYSAEQKEEITHVTPRCESCGEPITTDMFARGDVKPCLVCGKKTCPRCRANTDLHEYLKPQARGQPVCLECWNSPFIAKELFITCPSCDQPVRNYTDIKTCIDATPNTPL
jgi:hypothetical protein